MRRRQTATKVSMAVWDQRSTVGTESSQVNEVQEALIRFAAQACRGAGQSPPPPPPRTFP